MKKIVVLPSWYPTNENPVLGIYFKEQIEALNELDDLEVSVLHVKYLGIHRIKEFIKTKKFFSGVRSGVNERSFIYLNIFPKLTFLRDRLLAYYTINHFKKLIKKTGKPDLIHAHVSYPAGYQAYILSKKFNIPFIVTEHATFFNKVLLGEFKRYTDVVLKEADHYVAVSSFLAKKIQDSGRKQCDVIPNFINTDKFQLENFTNKFQSQKFNLLNISDLSHKKGIDILLKALNIVVNEKHIKDVHLNLIGDGVQKESLKELIKEFELENYCTFHGRIQYELIPEYINSADALVISSRKETFAVVGIEALACGKPVISTKCEGPEDYITDETGILIDSEDFVSLANSIIKIKINFNSYSNDKIKKYAKLNYSKTSVSEIYAKLYNSL